MNKAIFVAGLLALGQQAAAAAPATAMGPAALALAAVVARHSPLLRPFDQRVLARIFGGNSNVGFVRNAKIAVQADSVTCRVSNVDITTRSCELTFMTTRRTVRGREANEIFATIASAGVASEGAAGSIIESVSNLDCAIDPAEIRQKAGGGASCTFQTGQ
jgi:hypothetical protein